MAPLWLTWFRLALLAGVGLAVLAGVALVVWMLLHRKRTPRGFEVITRK
jgi:hypothetical protein